MTEQAKPLPSLTLVLGGQRSGKSAYAEGLLDGPGVYLATGHATDPDMAERIEAHQERRGQGWVTVEEPLDLEKALKRAKEFHPGQPVLIDSLGMWVSNMLHDQRAPWSIANVWSRPWSATPPRWSRSARKWASA